jgi:sulfur transfer complex TusBCD TusB component (DsrH family)
MEQKQPASVLCKLFTDEKYHIAFKTRFKHTVDEYINSFISEKDEKVLIQSAIIVIHDENDNKKDKKK